MNCKTVKKRKIRGWGDGLMGRPHKHKDLVTMFSYVYNRSMAEAEPAGP